MDKDQPRARRVPLWGCVALATLFAGAGLVFVPLFLSIAEYLLFGSSYVEQWFHEIGLHSALGRIYAPFIVPLRWMMGLP